MGNKQYNWAQFFTGLHVVDRMHCGYFTCSALVQLVESDDVHLAHLGGQAELDAGVRDGHQGGQVVL